MESSPQVAEDILGREVHHGVVQEPRIETSQRLAAGEDQVGGEFRLIDDPIVAEAAKPPLPQKRIDLANQAVEDLGPVLIGERIGQLLSGLGIVQGREGVVLQVKTQPSLEHLLFQPGVTIDVDLDGQREPSRQADVDQPQLGIEKVEVQDALLAALVAQAGAGLGGDELEAGTAFHTAEDTDQALENGPLPENLIDQFVLAALALKEAVFSPGFLGQTLGVLDQSVGLFSSEGHEILSSNPQDMIDKPFEGRPVGDGQIALENDAVKAREHGDDQTGKLGDEARKRLHGVLLRHGAHSNPILGG